MEPSSVWAVGTNLSQRVRKLARALAIFLWASAAFAVTPTSMVVAISPPVPLGTGIYPGSVLTVNATVSDSNGPVSAGTVNVCLATVISCNNSNRLGTAQVTSSGAALGTATIRIRLGAGANLIKVFYVGTTAESADVSSAFTVKVSSRGGGTSTTTVAATAVPGGYDFSSTVAGASGVAPTGVVKFLDQTNADYSLASGTLGASALTYGFASPVQAASLQSGSTAPMSVADFNQDGFPDVAAVTATGSVVVLFGDGTGKFPTSNSIGASGAVAVVAGDFNADGIVDLAVVNNSLGSVQIYLGTGSGTFSAGPSLTLASAGSRIITGDFNDDGILDLAVTNTSAGTVSVFLGTGTGGFIAMTPIAVGNAPVGLVTADFDGNEYGDLAVANSGDGTIRVLLGSVSGGAFVLTPQAAFTAGANNGVLVTGDFNGDGITDLATADGVVISMIPGTGTGTFNVGGATMYSASSSVSHLSAHDVNGDGITDLLATEGTQELLLLGSSSGTLTPLTPTAAFTIGASPAAVAVADFNGDGTADVFAINSGSSSAGFSAGGISYLASVSTSLVTIPGAGTHLIVASYQGDSTYAGSVSSAVSVVSTPTATTTGLTVSPGGVAVLGEKLTLTATVTPASLGAETLVGTVTFYDGATALTPTVAPNASGVAVYTVAAVGTGSHSYTAVYSGDANFLTSTSAAVVLYGAYPSSLTLSSSPGAPLTSTSIVTLTATAATASGPAVTTGTVKFCKGTPCTAESLLGTAQIVAATSSASIKIHLEPGTYSVQAFFGATTAVSASSSSVVPLQVARASLIADALSLSKASVTNPSLTQYQLSSSLSAASNQIPVGSIKFSDTSNSNLLLGTQTFTAPASSVSLLDGAQSVTVGNQPDAISYADVNGDGYPDLIVANANDATVSILLNDGTGKFSLTSTVTVGGSPYAIVTGDFKGNGHQDIAVANALGNSVTILLGDGTGHFTSAGTPVSTGFTPTAIVTGDFNSDGNLDLAVANYFDSSVSILYGNGSGGFTAAAPLLIANSASPLSIAVGDVNQDGLPDLVVPDSSGTINIYCGTFSGGFPAAPTTTITTTAEVISVALADLNNDGNLDLIYTDYLSGKATILFGDGTAHFPTGPGSITVGSNPSALVIGDFNGDGLEDVLVTTSSPNQVVEVTNLGGGTFATPVQFPIQGVAGAMASADFALNGIAGFGIVLTAQNAVDIAKVQYALADPVVASPVTVYGGGLHNVVATYAGDTNFADATSASVSLQGNLIATALTLGLGTTPAVGSTVMLSATVSPNSLDNYVAGGTVAFVFNGSTLCAASPVSAAGVATCATGALTAGNYSVSATYTGDTNFAGSNGSLSGVTKATPVIVWAAPASIVYGTALSGTQLNATSTTAGDFTYSPVAGMVPAAGVQTLTVTFTPTDIANNIVVTKTVSLTVTKAVLTVTANSFSIGLTQAVPTLTASIAGFVNGDSSISSISGAPSLTMTPPSPTVAGSYPIVAGIGALAASNYSFQLVNGVLTISQGTVPIVLSVPTTANIGGAVSLTATLSPSTSVAPTGAIAFMDGGTRLGTTAIGASNTVVYGTSFSVVGNHSITAVYAGDANYAGYTTTAHVVDVIAAGYTITATPTSLVIHAGQTAVTTVTMNSVGGFKGTVTLSCVGLPDWAGCMFAPPSLTADGSGTTVSSKMMITTLGSGSGVVTAMNSRPGGGSAVVLAEIWLPLGLVSLLLMGAKRRSVAARRLLLGLLMAGTLITVSGCGSVNCCSVPEATVGTYSLTITATPASGLPQTAVFSLQVLP